MKLLYIQENNKDRFNDFLENHPRGHPLQTWNWGEVKARTGWQPFRLAVEENGELIATASILKRELPWIQRSIFYTPRGPVIDWKHHNLVKFLLGGIRKLAEEENALMLKIDPDVLVTETDKLKSIESQGLRPVKTGKDFAGVQPNFVMRLDLRGRDEEQLLAAFHSKTRYNIRYAFRNGIEVKNDGTLEDLNAFYKLLRITAERDKFSIRSREYFTSIWEYMVKGGFARLSVAYHEGQPLAGAIAFRLGGRVWYVYGASSNEKRNLMPNYAVQWELIRWTKKMPGHTYDLRGVSGDIDPDNPLYGLYRFKKGFDAELFELGGEFDRVYKPGWYWFWRHTEPLYRKLRFLVSK